MDKDASTALLILIDFLALNVLQNPDDQAEYTKFREIVNTLVKEKRNPTDEEWGQLLTRLDETSKRLQGTPDLPVEVIPQAI